LTRFDHKGQLIHYNFFQSPVKLRGVENEHSTTYSKETSISVYLYPSPESIPDSRL